MINGIKPKMTTTTKLRIKPTSFDEAMTAFCTKLEENVKPYVDKFNHMDSVTFRADGGVKYIKVKSFQVNINTDYNDDGTITKTLVGGKWTKYWILVKIYVKYQYLKFYIMNSSMWWKVFKLKWFKGDKNG